MVWITRYYYTCFADDIAVDWVANNLYWVDAVWARIEVLDLDNNYRKELIHAGPNTNPRGIAVDPATRLDETHSI